MSDLHVSFTSTDYATTLRQASQRLAAIYGLGQRQLWRAYRLALRQPGDPCENLLVMLERRLESLVVRAGFAPNIAAARQIITRHHVSVDGRGVNQPSQRIGLGQVIKLHPRHVQPLMLLQYRTDPFYGPSYLSVDYGSLQARMMRLPVRDEIPCDVDERLIAQYYTLH
jgi:small subunit ribosomal protein S4